MQYSQEALEEMADQVDLLEYASRSVDFVRHSGNTYYAVCPFHNEKTASLAVNTDENFYHCFGCGRSGNIYKWIQWTEGLTFDQAVKKVANITGSEEKDYIESELMSFYKLLNRLCAEKKHPSINRPILDIDRDYKQKFKDECPQEWITEGINVAELQKYEVRIDPISNRIVYPVYDADYQLIGVKGRTRFKNYKELGIMKYMNYHRLGVLDFFTGAKQAADYIKQTNEIVIVEGIKSVMKLDQWGYHNAVSAETSTLNEYQIELLIRMQVKDVVIAFDKDVSLKKIKQCTALLRKFANCYAVVDRWKLLDDKDSPPDRGKDIWEKLYGRRERI